MKKHGFSFKKSLGQNFLINADVCPQMAEFACNKNMGVLEIGPGIGVLSKELSLAAKRVVAIELDERLKAILPETLAECDNVEVIFGDAMKLDLKEIIAENFADKIKRRKYFKSIFLQNDPFHVVLFELQNPQMF